MFILTDSTFVTPLCCASARFPTILPIYVAELRYRIYVLRYRYAIVDGHLLFTGFSLLLHLTIVVIYSLITFTVVTVTISDVTDDILRSTVFTLIYRDCCYVGDTVALVLRCYVVVTVVVGVVLPIYD